LVAVSLIGSIAWPTWLLHQRYDAYLEDYTTRLARYRRIAALHPVIEESIADVKARDARRYYLKGTTPALAAAELQGLVTKIVESNKGRIISSQTLAPSDATANSGAAKVMVSVQLNAAIIPLQLILHALEGGEPYLFIDQMEVRSSQNRNYKPVPGVQPEFNIRLNVYGFVYPGRDAT
jgi:general secretion pathway protein M